MTPRTSVTAARGFLKKLRRTNEMWTARRNGSLWRRDLGLLVELRTSAGTYADIAARERILQQSEGIVLITVDSYDDAALAAVERAAAYLDSWSTRRRELCLPRVD